MPKLHVDSLAKKTNRKALRSALKSLPKETNATYDEAMQRIRNQDEEEANLAFRALMWIIFALRPLTVLELRHALAIEVDQKNVDLEALVEEEILISICAGLVTLDQKSGIIRLVHYTTQEYFEVKGFEFFPNVHQEISTTCLSYLSSDCFIVCIFPAGYDDLWWREKKKIRNELLTEYPFYAYAAANWGHHARRVKFYENQTLTKFLSDSQKTSTAGRVAFGDGFDANGMILAAYFGLTAVVDLLLRKGIDVDLPCGTRERALHWAARMGNEALILLLLDRGADIDARNGRGETVLHWAVMDKREAAVLMLLE